MPTSRRRVIGAAAPLAALTLALSACGSTSSPTPAAPASSATSTSASSTSASTSSGSGSTPAAGATVKTATTSLGSVVVDAKGMTLYMYTKDTNGSGTSACTGQCLAAWPPLLATGTPTGVGVSGTLGTINTPDGKHQVTLNGWPLYYWAKDAKPGDVTGQNVGKVWFVLDQTGTPKYTSASGGPTA
jgi:predicted lipoprotein with Yx(FWY)xxD motif